MPLFVAPRARAFALLAVSLVPLAGSPSPAAAQVRRASFEAPGRSLVLEALDDDLIHFEFADRSAAPGVDAAIPTSIMVQRTDYNGPSAFSTTADGLETADVRIVIQSSTLCFTATEKRSGETLTTLCPSELHSSETGLTLTRNRIQNLYGMGEQFLEPGNPDGDWSGRERTPGNQHGNRMVDFNGGQVGNAMFPILYAVGDGVNYALFLDNVYAQWWDFRGDPWRVRTRGGELRGYLITGPDLPDLRRDYLELVGRPPVPPKKAFGLWVSEYGFENWHELDTRLASLRASAFPVDGFVLDLQWFGGLITGSEITPMGSLTWDEKRFPNPGAKLAQLRSEQGVGIIPIEESYIGRALPEHAALESRGFLVRQGEHGPAVYLSANPWWGKGGMIDWTNHAAGAFWHDWKRQPLVEMGVVGHWTDLGEPEQYDSTAWYHGVVAGKHDHADIHNLYNLKWSESIARGYQRNGVQRRPLSLSRSGTSGIQRYGVAMWSGDIGSNLSSLAAHLNVQMHVSMSGIDYFGSDIGGFHRGTITGDSLNELYTQWFATGALLDVPVRPHTENLCNCKETAPDRIGHAPSNLANIRLRYELAPYYYSLAHRAYLHGEPVVAPLVFYHQGDRTSRTSGDEKLIGRDLLVASVAGHGQTVRDVYLPRGRWLDYYDHTPYGSEGTWIRNVPLYRDRLFRLPLFMRAGAIIPKAHVDEKSMNILGKRTDGSARDELVVRIYPDSVESRFILYEDDGETVAYREGAVATTALSQLMDGQRVVVTIGERQGEFRGAPERRNNVIELVGTGQVGSVRLNGRALRRHPTRTAFDRADSGWFAAGRMVIAKSGVLPASRAKVFEFRERGR